MASKDEKNKIKIIQAVLDFHTKDLISTIQMELKKTNACTPAGASASRPLPVAALLAIGLDERHEPAGGVAETR
jgi:hypothetical protein